MIAQPARTRFFARIDRLAPLILLVTTLLALPVITYPLGRDQGEFATIARGLLNGRVPYLELWNPKPPAIFYVYALAMSLFGQTEAALRSLDFAIVPLTAVALYFLGKRIAGRPLGLWAALIFPVFYFTETFWTLTQNDGIVLLPMTLAVLGLFQAADRAGEPQAARWALLTGALAGIVFWFKYPFALFTGLLILGYLGLRWPLRRSDLRPILAFIIGLAALLLLPALVLIGMGAWPEFIRSAQVTASYTALTFNPADFRDLMTTALGFRWSHWGLLFVLSGIGLVVAALPGRVRSDRAESASVRSNRPLAFVILWLLISTAIMLVQAKGYDYHWLPMLPPLALLAAYTLHRIVQRLRSSSMQTAFQLGGAVVLLGILIAGIWPKTWPYLTGQEDRLTYAARFTAGAAEEFRADESLKVAALLRERVVPGDSLYIWGFRPEIYYLSHLNPATRFIFQFPLVGSWYPPEWRDQNVEVLWAALPPYVLVMQVDYMPWVTGSPEDSNTLLQGYTELNNWLLFNYERDTQIGNIFLWRRKPPA
ncbi:MAG: glycosyltransferase family 39 protein [Anaerolineae bacterium]|nr:glycosyltransferase family 39 protein [Anaerolineae bacterium]